MHVQIDSSKAKDGIYKALPDGPIDSETHAEFREKLEPLLTEKTRVILLDLTRVNYISSAGLGVLFSLKKKLLANKGELLFTGVQPQIKKLFEVVKALPKETLFVSAEEADRYFYTIMNQEIDRQRGGKKPA